jgi:hypothetical protein
VESRRGQVRLERAIPSSQIGDIPVVAAPDGDTLAVLRITAGRGGDIYALSMRRSWPARAVVSTTGYDGGAAALQPNGPAEFLPATARV